jgi:O-methyltransferase involved in polyketide biosynthesis/ribosomal protein S18 acetylase RimI-like enzyme
MSKDSVTRTAADALLAKWSAVDAGYQPVGEQKDVYKRLLQQMSSASLAREGIRQTRQSPLVNAGYAARIACMTKAVESFLSYHKSATLSTSPPVQVVLLGCGLDILGIWALSQSPRSIKLFEVDTLQVVKAKKELFESFHWLKAASTVSDNGTMVVEGRISIQTGDKGSQSDVNNYTLASCDLKDVYSVEKALANVDRTMPTLVLTELVLPYLGREGIDDLLRWSASNLCTSSGSTVVAYEALDASNKSMRSVVDGYKHQYLKRFRDKLNRGEALEDNSDDTNAFFPLGDCPDVAKKRFTASGFPWCQSALAGTVAASVFDQGDDTEKGKGRSFRPCEPFDEHAALALHLHSYAFVCAFPEQTDIELVRCMCPWSTISIFDTQPTIVQADDGAEVCIRPIEAADQQEVQDKFIETYKELSEQRAAVRKLLKTALNTTMKFPIGLRYQTAGGIFLVAVGTKDNSEHVLGCIGIRRCETSECSIRTRLPNTFEIHHLAVDSAARGKGIGKALQRVAETEFIQNEIDGAAYRLVAVTLTLLKKANLFYKSNGFRLEKEETIGELTYNTYVKEVQPTSSRHKSD